MSNLSLAHGRQVTVSVTFVCPDDEYVSMTSGTEVQAAVAEGLMTSEVTSELLDRETGMNVTPIAQITILREDGSVESSVFMTRGELIRHDYECRAVIKTMDAAAKLADREWRVYREGIRRRS